MHDRTGYMWQKAIVKVVEQDDFRTPTFPKTTNRFRQTMAS